MGTARDARWYDQAFLGSAAQQADPRDAGWYPLWSAVLDEIPRDCCVLDLGCGSGQLASMWSEREPRGGLYVGLDFSCERIRKARERAPTAMFLIADIYSWSSAYVDFPTPDIVVMTEVLEHLERDVEVIESLPSGSLLILSVPTTDSASHVRHFPDIRDAVDRYGRYMRSPTAWSVGGWHIMRGNIR